MTTAQAIQRVIRAAEANANGHEDCLEILRAIELVKQLLSLSQTAGASTPAIKDA